MLPQNETLKIINISNVNPIDPTLITLHVRASTGTRAHERLE